jgi:hypothetical protein
MSRYGLAAGSPPAAISLPSLIQLLALANPSMVGAGLPVINVHKPDFRYSIDKDVSRSLVPSFHEGTSGTFASAPLVGSD